ncbi:MAG TPA: hypothetical protein VKU82_11560 [Planctomycetaceae bacterium]|nr:hypothetical protein [Planctomycetaceae bacterium]
MSMILAYFDPGSGSLLLQAIVGGAAGLFVLVKYLWDLAPSLVIGRKAEPSHGRAKAGV